ncbi:hypothetical protein ACTFIR_008530 [Dictyostelium discoideum]
MNNINKYDNKCAIHKEYDIKLICSTCKIVVCIECIVSGHTGHKFDHIDVENSKEIFEEFKNNHIQNLDKQIDINNDNNNYQHIEILKHCHQSKILIKDNQNENKINDLINQYKNVNIVNNSEQVRNSIKEIFEISNSVSITNENDPKRVTLRGYEYFIYKNDSIVPNGTKFVAISPSTKTIKIGSIPTSVQSLLLLDGFNVQLIEGMLPQSIKSLLVGAIKKPLLKGSIPNRVKYLYLLDGFNQEITEIPPSACLFLFDTPLTNFPFPNIIFRTPKYKQLKNSNVSDWDSVPIREPKIEL